CRSVRRRRLLESARAGLPAVRRGQPGQVRKEAATAISRACRGSGSPTRLAPRAPAVPLRAATPRFPDMNHLALARKWRPRDFDSLVGQEHVVRALSHALETKRLHHAYLFTGT